MEKLVSYNNLYDKAKEITLSNGKILKTFTLDEIRATISNQ